MAVCGTSSVGGAPRRAACEATAPRISLALRFSFIALALARLRRPRRRRRLLRRRFARRMASALRFLPRFQLLPALLHPTSQRDIFLHQRPASILVARFRGVVKQTLRADGEVLVEQVEQI